MYIKIFRNVIYIRRVGYDEIDNEEKETIKVSCRMCDIKGNELAMVVKSIIALGDKLGIFDNRGDDNEDD